MELPPNASSATAIFPMATGALAFETNGYYIFTTKTIHNCNEDAFNAGDS